MRCHVYYPQYSQYVPHDTAKLIELQGGAEPFVERLDFIFKEVRTVISASLSIVEDMV